MSERAPWFSARQRRVVVRRWFRFERWRVGWSFRVFRGHGLANFEFEFKLGFPRHSPNAARQIEEMLRDEPSTLGCTCAATMRPGQRMTVDRSRCPIHSSGASHSQKESS